jgi:DNA modification methylase
MRVVDVIPLDIGEGESFTFAKKISSKVNTATHAIHEYPAKFIPEFPKFALKYSSLKTGLVYDPFNGSGTTLLEAKLSGLNGIGTDINPLSKLITESKTKIDSTEELNKVIFDFSSLMKTSESTIRPDLYQKHSDIKIMENFDFWFPIECLQDLIVIKRSIANTKMTSEHSISFFTVILSSIVKSVSYWDKRQIKVKKKSDKFDKSGIPDTLALFREKVHNGFEGIKDLLARIDGKNGTTQHVEIGSSSECCPEEVDLIITSPPYINAIDYTMVHKFSFFILDLITPEEFKDHCREYIGMTERAVRVAERNENKRFLSNSDGELDEIYASINHYLDRIGEDGSNTSQVREYITYTYFRDMEKAISLWHKSLKNNRLCFVVIGPNNIRNVAVPTHELIRDLMKKNGFVIERTFNHVIHSRAVKTGRNTNAGIIEDEMVIIARKVS